MSWTEVRRSVPAVETSLVPDRCIDWYCVVERPGNRSYTVYKDPEADEHPYIVTMRYGMNGRIKGEFEDTESAVAYIDKRIE